LRRLFAILAGSALLLLALAGEAIPQGRIILRGPASGTHLRLTVEGGNLQVSGALAEASEGCDRGRGVTSCSLRGVGEIEVDTGPADDKVEVLDPLPVPLSAYLGDGSDKLIGNSERDFCHPQGTPRNRCIGEAGDDVCISGPVNTDCVGGPGDDLCKTGDGSDGCWGGPGKDICMMGGGEDGCHGEGGNDRLYGGPGADQLYGGPGKDYCDVEGGGGQVHECELGPRGRHVFRNRKTR
jgi:hypothetical protein